LGERGLEHAVSLLDQREIGAGSLQSGPELYQGVQLRVPNSRGHLMPIIQGLGQ
jgi:hypothetical protein